MDDYGGLNSTNSDGDDWPYCDLSTLEASLRKVGLANRVLWYIYLGVGGSVLPPMVLFCT